MENVNNVRPIRTEAQGTYLAIDTADTVAVINQALKAIGLDPQAKQLHGLRASGRRTVHEWVFPELREEIDGQEMLFRVALKNGAEPGVAFSLFSGFYRIVCANGLVIGEASGTKIIHRVGQTAETLVAAVPDAVRCAIESFTSGEAIGAAQEAAELKVLNPFDVIGGLNVPTRVKDKAVAAVAYGLNRPEDNALSAWGLYNLVNEVDRRGSRSRLAAALRDFGLLGDVVALTQAQHGEAA